MTAIGKNKKPFDTSYWKDIYQNGEDVDGTHNAREHIQYIASLFKLMGVEVDSVVDFGFGMGHILKEAVREWKPTFIRAVDGSAEAHETLNKNPFFKKRKVEYYLSSLESLKIPELLTHPADLGICNSVLQYIHDKDLEPLIAKMSQYCSYLYCSVPTDMDYLRMMDEFQFEDPYAYSRKLAFYRKKFAPHFKIVSFNLLQSRRVPSANAFQDELFLF